MTQKQYATPPIVSATLRARFCEKYSKREFQKLSKNLEGSMSGFDRIYAFELKQRADGTPTYHRKVVGCQYSPSDDETVMLTHDSIQVKKTGPYQGWENLVGSFEQALSAIDERDIKFIGARYDNKVALQVDKDNRIELGEYFNIFLSDDQYEGSISLFSYRSYLNILFDEYLPALEVFATPTDVEGIISFAINIEVDSDKDGLTSLAEGLGGLRNAKNTVFERLITEKVRELF